MTLPRGGVLLVAALLGIVPLFAARYLPFSDLPEHVATISAFQHFHDPSFRVAEHFTVAWGESQYFLYHLVGAALAWVIGDARVANLVLLSAVGIAYPFTTRALLRAAGRDERLALFACPLFFSHALVVGLLPFVASVPCVVGALALVMKDARSPSRRGALVLGGIAVLLLFVHVTTLIVFGLASVGIAYTETSGSPRARLRALARRVSWLAPSGALLLAWSLATRMGNHGASLLDHGQVKAVRFGALFRAFAFWSHDVWPSHVDEGLAVVFWSTLALLAVARLARRSSGATSVVDEPPRRAALVPLLATAAVYVVLPFRVGATDSVNVRLGVFVPIFALLLVDLGRGLVKRIALSAAAFLVVGSAVDNVREVRAAQASLGDFDRVLAAMEPGARVVTLTSRFDSPPDHFPPWVHVTAYHRVVSGGTSEPSFATLGHWPLHYRPEVAPPKKRDVFWEFNPCLFRNAEDGPYYDHVLVYGPLEPFADEPPGPAFDAVLKEGPWTLYRRRDGVSWPAWPAKDEGPCAPRPKLASRPKAS